MIMPDFLTRDEHGDIRLSGHRIGLEDVAYFYDEGYSPEMLCGQFPTLTLAHIHKTIAFILENRTFVSDYLAAQASASERLKASLPRGPSLTELRQRLEAKRRAEADRHAAGLSAG